MNRALLFAAMAAVVLMGAQAAAAAAPAPAGLALALVDTQGKPADLTKLLGRTTLLNYWATWCVPCREEMPVLDRIQREFAVRGFKVVGLAADELAEVNRFLQKVPVKYAIAVGDPDAVFEHSAKYGNTALGLPYSVLIDRQGKVLWRKSGATSIEAELRKILATL